MCRSLVFNLVMTSLFKCEISFKMFWWNISNSVKSFFRLQTLGMCSSNPNDNASSLDEFYFNIIYLNMSLLLVGLLITFSDLSYVSGLDILSSYFISFIVWIADIGQVSVNVTLIIALIINFTFLMYFYPSLL